MVIKLPENWKNYFKTFFIWADAAILHSLFDTFLGNSYFLQKLYIIRWRQKVFTSVCRLWPTLVLPHTIFLDQKICCNLQGRHLAGQKCEGYYQAATSILLRYCLHCCNKLFKDISFSLSSYHNSNNAISILKDNMKEEKTSHERSYFFILLIFWYEFQSWIL